MYIQQRYRTRIDQNGGMCPGQFLENGWKKQNAIYRDSSTAQAEFKSTNKSKIGSLYMEIFQHKGTLPNAQRSRVLGLQSQNWPSKTAKTLYKVYIFRIYVRRAIQNSIIYTRSDETQSDRHPDAVVLSNASRGKIKGKFTGQFLYNGWTQKNEIRIIFKNEPNRYILRGVIAIIRYRTKWSKKRGDRHSEPKLTMSTT